MCDGVSVWLGWSGIRVAGFSHHVAVVQPCFFHIFLHDICVAIGIVFLHSLKDVKTLCMIYGRPLTPQVTVAVLAVKLPTLQPRYKIVFCPLYSLSCNLAVPIPQ